MGDNKHRSYTNPITVMGLHDYISFIMVFNNLTKEQATNIAHKAYIEQYGKTPEEHQREMDSVDWKGFFDENGWTTVKFDV